MKKALLLVLVGCSLWGSESTLVMPLSSREGTVKLLRSLEGFSIERDGVATPIPSYDVEHNIRDMDTAKLLAFLNNGYVKVNECSDGSYVVKGHGRLHGGGAIGATIGAFLGKAAVSVVGHGSIVLVSTVVGVFNAPAGVSVGIALESTCGHMIEVASIKGAIAGGILLGAATGPA